MYMGINNIRRSVKMLWPELIKRKCSRLKHCPPTTYFPSLNPVGHGMPIGKMPGSVAFAAS